VHRAVAVALALALAGGCAGPAVAAGSRDTLFAKLPHLFGSAPSALLSAREVLRRYETALTALQTPRFLAFTFAVDQVGAHDLSQTHRVFRDGRRERDETLVTDGFTLRNPDVRIFTSANRYAVASIAPRARAYAFKLVATRHDGDHDTYLFDTAAHAPAAFAVTSVAIDGLRFLPVELGFHIDAGSLRGKGRLTYGLVDRYWLVRLAEVATNEAGLAARERIVWSQYQFPERLPASTFNAREALPAPGRGLPRATRPLAARTPFPAGALRVPSPQATLRIGSPPATAIPAPLLGAPPAKPHVTRHRLPAVSPRPVASDEASPPPGLLQGPVTPAALPGQAAPAATGATTVPPAAAP